MPDPRVEARDDLTLGWPRTRLIGDREPDGSGDGARIFPPGSDLVSGGPGDDNLHATGGPAQVRAWFGRDFLCSGPCRDVLDGGPGRDAAEHNDTGDQFLSIERADRGFCF